MPTARLALHTPCPRTRPPRGGSLGDAPHGSEPEPAEKAGPELQAGDRPPQALASLLWSKEAASPPPGVRQDPEKPGPERAAPRPSRAVRALRQFSSAPFKHLLPLASRTAALSP